MFVFAVIAYGIAPIGIEETRITGNVSSLFKKLLVSVIKFVILCIFLLLVMREVIGRSISC